MAGYFELFVYQAGAPQSGTVDIYRQGGTSTDTVSVHVGDTGVTVPVNEVGKIAVNDILMVDGSSATVKVTTVSPPNELIVKSNSLTDDVTINNGSRLTPVGSRPTFYADPCASSSLGSSLTSDGTIGRAAAWVCASIFDIRVSGGSLTTVMHPDLTPKQPHTVLNVLDFDSPASAIALCPPGGRVYFPSGIYTAPAGGWTLAKPIEVFGDGVGTAGVDNGTSIHANSANDHVFVLQAPIQNVFIHDLKLWLSSRPGADGTGDGIHCLTTTGNAATEITLQRLAISNLGNDGIHIEGADFGDSAVIFLRILDCEATLCRGNGLYLKNCTSAYVIGGYVNNNGSYGLYASSCGGIRLISLGFEKNQNISRSGTTNAFNTQLRLSGSHGFSVIGCHLEDFASGYTGTALKTAVTIEFCLGGMFEGGFIGNNSEVSGSRGIFINTSSRAIVVSPVQWNYVDTLIEVNASDNNTGCVILPQVPENYDAGALPTIILPDQDGNGNFAFVPTTKTSNVGAGLLLPRITTSVRNAIPAGILQRGLVAYDSTRSQLVFYDGSHWRETSGVTGVATLAGGVVTVSNSLVTSNTRVFVQRASAGGTIGDLTVSVSAGSGFTINSSSGTDTSVVNWMLVEGV